MTRVTKQQWLNAVRKKGVDLSARFDKGLVDQRFNKAGEIDPIKEMADREFDKFSAYVFL